MYPYLKAVPNKVGLNIEPYCFAYPLSWTCFICSWIVASVPMPFLSIKLINSASVKKLGGDVIPLSIFKLYGTIISPSIKFGTYEFDQKSNGYISK